VTQHCEQVVRDKPQKLDIHPSERPLGWVTMARYAKAVNAGNAPLEALGRRPSRNPKEGRRPGANTPPAQAVKVWGPRGHQAVDAEKGESHW
jgi:hypothetical protein